MNTEAWIDRELEALRREDRERRLVPYPEAGGRIRLGDREVLNLSCNDYLDLAGHPEVKEAAAEAARHFGAGATASRLVTGTLPVHVRLEDELAKYKEYPAALVFGSGYLANAGTITALVGKGDLVFADRLVHASVLDAIRLSRARLLRFRHNDPDHLRTLLDTSSPSGRRLVVTESVFSMDGDIAPLRDIADLAAQCQAMLMVDEAHATGVFGPGGRGLVSELGLTSAVTVSMGTLSKALGSYGGFVACSTPVRDLLVNRARSFIYTTASPPAVAGAALAALEWIHHHPGAGRELLERAECFRKSLQQGGLDTLASHSQIIPVRVGENAKALSLARALKKEGILAIAIRPPTVPAGTARLRLSVTRAHTEEDLRQAAEVIIRTAHKEKVV